MKKQLHLKKKGWLSGTTLLAFMFIGLKTIFAQSVTFNTTVGTTGYTGTNSAGAGATAYITFVIQNNSGAPIKLTNVGNYVISGDGPHTLYYSTTSLSGAVDLTLTSTWLNAGGTNSTIPSATASVQEVLNNINFIIPAGATYRFALQKASGTNRYSGAAVGACTPSTFTTNGVSLLCGDASIGGFYVGYGAGNFPRWFTGFVTYEPVPQGPNNASISKLENPSSPFCAGNKDVIVRLKNNGTNILSTATIQWTLDNILQTPILWTSPLDTFGGSLYPNDTAITLATAVPFTSARTIKAWTELPNSVADTVNGDDTIQVALAPAMSGNYNIGGTSPDFPSIDSAVSRLKKYGVCGPVHFEVRPGTYSGQIDLNGISGVSATNTIMFEGVNKTTCIVTHAYVSGSYATWTIGVPYITLRNLTINATNANTGFGVLISNNAHYAKIINCNVNVPAVSSTACAGIAVSGSSTSPTTAARADYVEIDSTTVTGGYYSVVSYGASGTGISTGLKLTNSKLLNYYYNGAYFYYNSSVYIHNNTITATTAQQTGNGIYLSSIGFTGTVANTITNNVLTNQGYYGIYFSTATNPSVSNKGLLANNVIGGTTTSAINYYGIYMSAGTNWKVAHNTCNFTVPNTTLTYVPGYFTGGSAIACLNNIFRTQSVGYTFYGSAATIFDTLDYNTYSKDVKGANYFYLGAAYTDVTMIGAGSRNTNIVTNNPDFNSSTSFIPKNVCLFGIPVPSVATDINGLTRSTTQPTHGAYEVTPVMLDARVEKLTQPVNLALIGLQDAAVLIRNAGTTMLSSVDVNISVNGRAPVTVSWFGALAQCDSVSVIFNGSNQVQFDSTSQIVVYTSNPNFGTDLNKDNDTLKLEMLAPMSGSYTIGGPGANFASVVNAVAALKKAGVSGAVTFTVNPGTYAGQISLNSVSGVSATNTITFVGVDKATTIVTHTFTTGDYATWLTDNVSYVTLRNLTINAAHANTGFGIRLNNAHNCKIINCNVNAPAVSSTASAGITVSSSSTSPTTAGRADNLEIDSVTVTGGYYSVVNYAASGVGVNTGFKLTNSKLLNYYYYGTYLYYNSSVYLHNNTITATTAQQTGYGVYLSSLSHAGGVANVFSNNTLTNQGYYGFYFTTAANPSAANKGILVNNIIGGPTTSATVYYGIYMTTGTNWRVANNTSYYSVNNATLTYVPAYFTGGSGIACFNNIFRTRSVGYTFYGSAATIFDTLNYNVYSKDIKGANYFYLGSAYTDVTMIGAGSMNNNSLTANPAFSDETAGNLLPVSSNIDNIAIPVSTITTDITGALRSATTPDPGAFEFTGVAGDIAITGVKVSRSSSCYSANDTVWISIRNLVGTTIDFSIDPLSATWNSTGPVNATGTILVSSGTLAPDAVLSAYSTSVDMSVPGNYSLKAYISSNLVNLSPINDTFNTPVLTEVKPILSLVQKAFTVNSAASTVVLEARSPIFPSGGVFFSEISHYQYTVGAPTLGWPTYQLTDDYVELTGVPNSDLAGYTMEEWSTTAIAHTVTFPAGTLFSPNGTMVLATGQLNASVPSPANFYYHTGNTATHGSGDNWGYVLKNPQGNIIDAAVYGGTYTFPAASGVTATDWSGVAPVGTTTAGNRLIGPDNNTASNWANSSTSPQNPNVLNAGVPLPSPTALTGLTWYYNGSPIATDTTKVTVGPYAAPGVHMYVAVYTNACGTFYDTAFVTASATVPVKLVSFNATQSNNDVRLDWKTASEINNDHFEIEKSFNGVDFKTIGFAKGSGTTSQMTRYASLDQDALNTSARNLYYRLKQVDRDGSVSYSHIAVVEVGKTRTLSLSTKPNPSNGVFTIETQLNTTNPATVKVVNLMGATVWTKAVNPTSIHTSIDAEMKLPQGVYMLLLEQDGQVFTHKFVIE
jgi:hypothetical protein